MHKGEKQLTASPSEDFGAAYFKAVDRLLQTVVSEAPAAVELWYDAVENPLKQIVSIIKKAGPLNGQKRIDMLCSLQDTIKVFPLPAQRFSRGNLMTSNQKSVSRVSELLTNRVICPVEPDAFKAVSGDSLRTRYRKFICRFAYSVQSGIGWITSIFRRSKTPVLREFSGIGFVRYNLAIPFEKVLLEEWNRFNRASTDVIISINRHLDDHALDTTVAESAADDRISLALQTLLDVRSGVEQRLLPKIETLTSDVRKKLRISGTGLFPGKTFAPRAVRNTHRQFGRQFIKDRDAWRRHWQGVFMDLQKDIDLLHLEDEIHIVQSITWDTVERDLKDKTNSLFEVIKQIVVGMKKAAATVDLSSRNSTRTFLIAERKLFTGSAAEQHLTPINEIVMSFDLNGLLDTFRDRIKSAAELLQERYVIFTLSDREHLIPESQFDMIPLRELFLRHYNSELNENLEQINNNGRNNLIALSNQPVVLGEIVESMFDTAYMELRKNGKDDNEQTCIDRAMKEYYGGIDRTLTALEAMRKQLETTVNELKWEITETGNSMQVYLGDLRRSEHLIALKLKLVRSRAADRLTGYRERIANRTSRTIKWLLRVGRKTVLTVWRPLFRFYKAFSRITRLDVSTPQKDYSSVEAYLKMARNSLESLPAVYRRAFRFEPLDSEKLLTDREETLSAISTAYTDWHNGLTGLIALTGERGSGRSSIARIARIRYFNDIPVLRVVPAGTLFTESDLTAFLCRAFGIELVESIEMLERKIADTEDYRILIVEDIHHIFLRTITGLQIFKRFLLFATRTQGTIFWFLTCGEYVWRYLDKVLGLNRYFSTVVSLVGLSTDDIEELIIRRHRLCGIPIKFSGDNGIIRSKKYRQCVNERERQLLLQKQFFKKLTDASTGNVSVAMLIWCIAIKNNDHKLFEINGLPDLNLRIEVAVSSEELFVITAVLLHERMSPDDLANVLNLPLESALLHLTGLKNKGFLIEINGFYELHFFLYRTFIGYMHEKRLLH